MEQINVKLEMITELRSHGADKFQKEFRIPELKSLMRTTYREFFPSAKIKEDEDKLFGSTNGKSPIRFKLEETMNKNGNITSAKILMMTDDDNADFYKKLLVLSSITGVLGSKSRHGSGSFITNIGTDFKIREQSLGGYLKVLLARMGKTVSYSSNKNKEIIALNEDIDIGFPYVKSIHILKIDYIKRYSGLGDILEKHYAAEIKSINNKLKNEFMKGFYEQREKESLKERILSKDNKVKLKRFASPLYGSFYRYNGQNYIVFKELNYDYIYDFLFKSDKDGKYIYNYNLENINEPLHNVLVVK